MRKVSVSAKTVELAVAEALHQARVSRDRAEVVVRVAPSRGFWGLGARDAVVDVMVVEDPIGDAERFLREMLVAMRLAIRVGKKIDKDEVTFELTGDRVGILIGKHGQTLDAIQYLVNVIGNKYADKHVRFIVDAEGYRERRRQALVFTAQKMAERALVLGKEVRLQPMAAPERKVVHMALQDRPDVRTESRGTDPDRAIVIVPVAPRKASRVSAVIRNS